MRNHDRKLAKYPLPIEAALREAGHGLFPGLLQGGEFGEGARAIRLGLRR